MAVVPPGGYDNLVNALAASFTVHYVHRRGRGASGPQGHPYRIERELADVAAVLMATGARAVFGHSYGGLLALRSALHDPDGRITHLIAYEPAASIDGTQPTDYRPAFTRAVDSKQHARALTMLQRSLHVGGALDRLPAPVGLAINWALLATIGRPMHATLPTVPGEAREATRARRTGNRLRRHHRADTDPARRAGTVLAAVQRHGHRRNTAARPAAGDARTGPQRAPSSMRPRSSPPPPPSWRTTSPSATTVRRPRRPSGPTRGSWRRCGASPGSGPTAGPAR